MTTSEQHWLDVLRGERAADDSMTRQAARLRDFFVQREAAELAHPADPERLKRLLNRLDSLVVEEAAARRNVPARFGWLADWLARLFAPAGWRMGYAVAAVAILGVMLVPLTRLMLDDAARDDETYGVKTLRPAPQVDAALGARAAAIAAVLADLGIAVERTPVAGGLRLQATIPPQQQAAVAQALAAYQVSLTADGRLDVLLTR